MKKIILAMVSIVIGLSLCGCSDDKTETATKNKQALENYIKKLEDASDKSEASKRLDINNKDY